MRVSSNALIYVQSCETSGSGVYSGHRGHLTTSLRGTAYPIQRDRPPPSINVFWLWVVVDRVDYRRSDLDGPKKSHDDRSVEHLAKPGWFEGIRVADSPANAPDDQTSWNALGPSAIGCVTTRVAFESVTT